MQHSRRVFFGSAAVAGIGSVCGVAYLLSPQETKAQGHDHAVDGDPVFAELHRQLAAAVVAIRTGKSGEAARQVASTLRVLAVHETAMGLDDRFRAALRQSIRKDGKAAVAARTVDRARLLEEAKTYGLADLPPAQPVDFVSRERLIDEILAHGITAQFTKAAAMFDSMSAQLDERARSLQAVALRQSWSCSEGWGYVSALEEVMNAVCTLATFFPALLDACAAAFGAWAGALAVVGVLCW